MGACAACTCLVYVQSTISGYQPSSIRTRRNTHTLLYLSIEPMGTIGVESQGGMSCKYDEIYINTITTCTMGEVH